MVNFFKKFLYLIGDGKRSLVLLTFAFTLTSFLEVLGIGLIAPFLQVAANPDLSGQPALLQQAYRILGIDSSNIVVKLGLLIIILFFVKAFLYLLSRFLFFQYICEQRSRMIRRLLHAYLHAPYLFHLEKNSNLLIHNVFTGSMTYVFGYIYPILDMFVNFILMLTMLILMIRTDVLLLTMILGVLFPVVLLFFFLRTKVKEWGMEERKTMDEAAKVIAHGLGGIKETKVIGCEGYFSNQMNQLTDRLTRYANFSNFTSEVPKIFIECILASTIIGFVIFSKMVLQQNMESVTAVMGVFAVASIRLIPAATNITKDYNLLQGTTYSLNMVYEDLSRIEPGLPKQSIFNPAILETVLKEPKPQELEAAGTSQAGRSQIAPVVDFKSSLSLIGVNFRYPGAKELAIEDLHLELKKGQSVAFIGKSGAGKTTLVDLLLGLLQPSSGDIQVDGVSVYKNFRGWQNLLGYIPQSIFLMDDTFIRNVAFGVPDDQIDYQQLDWAIHAAQLTELVDQLPEGLNTSVGDRGLRLSGGQRQRVGIARALYHQREILVLDEATSALDNETEGLITESIKSLAGLKTMVVIAHRLSTIEHCDYVYALEKGRIVRSGTYAEVVTKV